MSLALNANTHLQEANNGLLFSYMQAEFDVLIPW